MAAVRPASIFPLSAEQLSSLRVVRGHVSYSLYQNISIAVWIGQATLPAVQVIPEVTKHMIARFPGGHSSVGFVLDGLPAPPADAQALLTKTFEKRSQLMVTAIVLEGSGFWASGLRGMLNNSHRDANSDAALKIVTHVDPLVGWFAEEHAARTGVEIAPMLLRDMLLLARQVGEKAARGDE
jgi:hypothetical protein